MTKKLHHHDAVQKLEGAGTDGSQNKTKYGNISNGWHKDILGTSSFKHTSKQGEIKYHPCLANLASDGTCVRKKPSQ